MNPLDFFSFFALVIVLLLSCKTKKIQSGSDYLFGQRSTKWGALTATLVMTEFNSATLLSFSALGYSVGFKALALPFIFLFGLLFYAFTVAKKWKEFNGLSVAGFFKERYGLKAGMSAAICLLLAMVGFSAVYIQSLTLFFQPLFPSVPPFALSTCFLLCILVMNIRGGLLSIIRTDIVSFLLILSFLPLLAFFIYKTEDATVILAPSNEALPLQFTLSLTLLTMFTYILAPWYGQKIFAAKSPKVAYWSVISAAIILFFFYGFAIFATALMRQKGMTVISADHALPALIHRCLPFGLKGVGYALIFATSATTLTSLWNTLSGIWVADFSIQKEDCPKKVMVLTALFALLSMALAHLLSSSVLNKMILANIPVAALSFGLLGGFYWKRANTLGFYLSLMIGCLFPLGCYLVFGEKGMYTWYWAIYGIPLTFLFGIIGSFYRPAKNLSQAL